MPRISRSLTAADVLRDTDVIVAKVGGDNAGQLRENYESVAARLQRGAKQILVVSAIRSSSPIYDAFADPKVVDRSADGTVKHGFNTTSHLVRIAKLLNERDCENRVEARRICQRIAEFTRAAVRHNMEGTDDRNVVKTLESVVRHGFDGPDSTSSLHNVIGPPGRTDGNGKYGEYDDKRSITGIGEELAQALYTRYFQLKGVKAGQLNIYSEEMRRIAQRKPHEEIEAQHLREEIALQLHRLLT